MRLPNGYGSVFKLKGNRRNPWVARKTIGWTDNHEKKTSYPKYKSIGYYPSRKAAMEALVEYNKNPYDLDKSGLTFAQVFDKFITYCEEKGLSGDTIKGHNSAYKLCAGMHGEKFAAITFEQWQQTLRESGKNKPMLLKAKNMISKLYEYSYVHGIHAVTTQEQILYLDVDLTEKDGKSVPSDMKKDKIHRAFTAAEVKRLWENLNYNTKWVLVLIYTGMRSKEFINVNKSDVHIEEKYIDIPKSKNKPSIRKVPIADKILPFVQEFIDGDGEYLCPYRTYSSFKSSVWRYTATEHQIHDTRLTCVSMLTAAGVDERIVKKIVGHAAGNVTEDVYTDLEISVLLAAINKI